MGYQDNSTITVDAILTKQGRKRIAEGRTLDVAYFSLTDNGVSYTLYNTAHPSGSSHYGEAIENLPMLEASVHAEYNLRNRLISLNQNTIAVPALVLGNLDVNGGTTLTFNEGDENRGTISVDLVGFTSTQNNVGNGGFQYYFVIQDPSIISSTATLMTNLSGTSRQFLQEQDIPNAQQYGFNGGSFTIKPIQQDVVGKQTSIYVVHVETGAYNSFTITNNITKNQRAVLSTVRSS